MAQYNYFNKCQGLEAELVVLDGYIACDSSGAVINTGSVSTAPLDVFGNPLLFPKGIKSVTEDGTTAGLFHILLEQSYPKVLAVIPSLQYNTGTAAGTLTCRSWNPNTKTPTNSATAKTIDIQYQVSGSAAHLTTGGFFITILLKNSNLP